MPIIKLKQFLGFYNDKSLKEVLRGSCSFFTPFEVIVDKDVFDHKILSCYSMFDVYDQKGMLVEDDFLGKKFKGLNIFGNILKKKILKNLI